MTYEKGNIKKDRAHRKACSTLIIYIRGAVRSSGNGMRHYAGKSRTLRQHRIIQVCGLP